MTRFGATVLALLLLPLVAAAGERVRIAVGGEVPAVELAGTGLVVRVGDGGDELYRSAGAGRVTVRAGARGLTIGATASTSLRLTASASSRLRAGNRELRGRLILWWEPGKPRLLVVNELDLEDYVLGVVQGELPGGWPAEAVKAQAVAARTFAMVRIDQRREQRFDLGATVLDQVYKGFGRKDQGEAAAVAATRGQVLTVGHELAEAHFHSTCGGTTASAAEVWGGELAHERSVRCGFCSASPRARWELTLRFDELRRLLAKAGTSVSRITALRVASRTPSGRVEQLVLDTAGGARKIPGPAFRAAVGYSRLYSLQFQVSPMRGGVRLRGSGAGHGVGMCQWGARGMARAGRDHRVILDHYYTGATVRRAY